MIPEVELNWFRSIVNLRILENYDHNSSGNKLNKLRSNTAEILSSPTTIYNLNPPKLEEESSTYTWLINNYNLNGQERITLLLALLPNINPELLDDLLSKENSSSFGGIRGIQHKGFLPTLQTVMHLLSGNSSISRNEIYKLFDDDHKFRKANILTLEPAPKGEPELSGALVPSREIVDLITRGAVRPPNYGGDFPAKRITTEMSWNDLVLTPVTKRQIEEVKIWMRQRERLFTELGLEKRMKPGYKILFYGSPGTGKTLTACLLGQYTSKHVFRIDLSMIVSKYIGETEKNISKVFDKAEHSDWILFFDEADALFGSRTKVSSSHDRYANQEVSYLLQRIEDYNGIVILASNMKGNIDDAFMRRFSSVVHFPFPKAEERQQLWLKAFPEKLVISSDVDLKKLSERYEMSGANITNIVVWCALIALEKGDMIVTDAMLREGMSRELAKEGRTL